MATGRSDFPNQVNNVLGFPFIFRGALDVHARAINMEMKIAAVKSLAQLAKEDVPDTVIKAYGGDPISFGTEYIIPKPFDPRVLTSEAIAVAKAAVETGVARTPIDDWNAYRDHLEGLLGKSREVMRFVINKAKLTKKRLVLPEGEEAKILRATQIILEEGIAQPILLGRRAKIKQKALKLGVDISAAEIVDIDENIHQLDDYVESMYSIRQRKGMTRAACLRSLQQDPNSLGVMMVKIGEADAMLSGVNHYYPQVIRPTLQLLEVEKEKKIVAGLYMMVFKNEILFFADTTVNINPSAEVLAEIAILSAGEVRKFDIEPHVAMLSFSNFGSVRHELTNKVAKAAAIVRERRPDIEIDGEMQVDPALDVDLLNKIYSFSNLKIKANVLIFPSLEAGNIAYKLMARVGGAEAIGPMLVGPEKSIHVLERHCDVDTIVNMSAIAVLD